MKGVLFDLDGVITDTAQLHFKAWSAVAKNDLDISLPANFENDLKGISRTDSINRILDFAGKADQFSSAEIETMLDKKNTYYLKEMDKLDNNDIFPGITNLLDQLKQAGILLSIASASKNAPAVLTKIGLIDKFDAIADPSKVAHGKPAPDIFIEAARKINLDPHECIGLEDAAAGVQSIKSANAIAVGIGNSSVLSKADKVVPSTDYLSLSLLENVYNSVK
ncbi:beta-phosphoglucomutase [Companilactobacillus kimchiensis]|uniref:Beta-phosphoglucomutase n=1 Tax=Companilactobacillus kimchiensis TaxID=993692 RepID=A0A0R2LJG6_9LACO|nr:beta-phosphoglucomutase [Companilactobacillus kimchiensis]KRN98781.1 pgmB protein [Companilactobacillus kimchiensis]